MDIKFYNNLLNVLLKFQQKVKLVAVTKYSNVNEINQAIKEGITIIGENRIEDFEEKLKNLLPVEKHFIGVIQSQKIRRIIECFDVIQSVGSYKHLKKINRIAEEIGKTVRVYLQINISSEPQKSGFNPSDLKYIKKEVEGLSNIKIEGIMGMAENTENENDIRIQFRLAKHVLDDLKKEILTIKELSMGMSNDYNIALEEGATILRIGRKLFQ